MERSPQATVRLSALLAGVAFFSCGDGEAPTRPAPPEPAVATTVTVSPATAELAAFGATLQLSAEVRDQNGRVMTGAALAWSSSDASAATVAATGVVTATGNGTVTITATSGSASGSATVTVEQGVNAVTVYQPFDTLVARGDTVRLTAAATDANGHPVPDAVVAWSSNDPSVAAVDASGLVTAAGDGTATITAAAGGASGTATVTVMQVPGSVAVLPAEAALVALGDTVRLAAEAFDANGHPVAGAEFSWASGDTAVATVDATGLVTAADNGTATITATSGPASGSTDVTIRQAADSIHVESGDGQQAHVSAPLPLPIVVRVVDAGGSAIADVTVVFETENGGSTTPRSADTDSLGLASTTWTLGSSVGAQALRASTAGTSVELHATALDPRPEVRITSGRAAVLEGSGPLFVTLEASPPPDAPLTVRYSIVEDSDPATTHADTADYLDPGNGAVEFTSGLAEIEIHILDDDRVEHPREAFVVALVASEDKYRVARQGSVVVEILEGVCDRTPAVAAEILENSGKRACHQITSHDLRAINPPVWFRPERSEDNPFQGFKEDDFAGLSNVRRLHIDGGDLFSTARTDTMHLPPGLFEDLEQLEDLAIVNTNLTTLPENLFAPLGGLRELSLWQNKLATLPRNLFVDMHELEVLNLNYNPQLASLPAGLFDDLTSLVELDLSCNRVRHACLREISPRLFANLGSLRTLNLERNALTVLRSDALIGLNSLEELNLGQNLLDDLPDGLLVGTAIERLYVAGNPGAPFKFAVNLVRLDRDKAAAGPALVAPHIPQGSPVSTSLPLLLSNARTSDSLLVISGGDASGESATITQTGSSGAYVSLGTLPEVPSYFGYRFERGDPIHLFATSVNQAPAVTESVPNHIIQVGGPVPSVDVTDFFSDPDGDALTIEARTFNETAVGVSVEGTAFELRPRSEGEALVEVSALDPEGFRATQHVWVVVLPEPDRTRFDVDVVWVGPTLPRQRELVRESRDRWTRVLIGDMPDMRFSGTVSCFNEAWRIFGVVDDMLVFVDFPNVGAVSGGAGKGGPCGLRDGSFTPYMGVVSVGYDQWSTDTGLIRIATHELGHALGFHAEVWHQRGLLVNPTWIAGLGADTHFRGVAAREAFDAAGGTDYREGSKVPVENAFSPDHHWKQSYKSDGPIQTGVFQRELMSVFGGPYLSAITVAAFKDLGYVVDLDAADPYELYDGATAAAEAAHSEAEHDDVCLGPIEVRDSSGRLVKTIGEGPATCILSPPLPNGTRR